MKKGLVKAIQKMYSSEKPTLLCTQWLTFTNLHGPTFKKLEVKVDRATLAELTLLDVAIAWQGYAKIEDDCQ